MKLDIKPKVTHRCCPKCGFTMSQLEIDLIVVAVKCPRCAEHSINDFQPINEAK
jgi:predicted Zn-ribbon and HTH transcriptional regulator